MANAIILAFLLFLNSPNIQRPRINKNPIRNNIDIAVIGILLYRTSYYAVPHKQGFEIAIMQLPPQDCHPVQFKIDHNRP